MSAFVQIGLELWTAWECRDVSDEERDLGLYIAFKTDFRTGVLSTTLHVIDHELGWNVPRSTTARRLKRLRSLGFVEVDVIGRGHSRRHVLRPTSSLLRPSLLAQQSATSRATNHATLKPAQEGGLDAPDATSRATSRATVEEKRRDLPSSVGSSQDGEEIAATTNGQAALPDEVYEWMHEHGVLASKLLCPECGQKCGTASGLASHIGHRHPDSPVASPRYREAAS